LQHRAWLKLQIGKKPRLDIVSGEPCVPSSFLITNIGSTPAIDIACVAYLVRPDEIPIGMHSLYSYYRKEVWRIQTNLFPGDVLKQDFRAQFLGEFDQRGDGLSLIIAVFYRTIFSDDIRTTAHIFTLGDKRNRDRWIDISQPIPATSLAVGPHDLDVGFAD
jgi:hypothetical protein